MHLAQPYRAYGRARIDTLPQLQHLSSDERMAMKVVASVLPFRVNRYVVESLIDWDDIPNDPIFQLTFPQRDMLCADDFAQMHTLVSQSASRPAIEAAAREIRNRLNPHPAGQVELNVPQHDGEPVQGVQHKYRETLLLFPAQGQTCHAYCTYCFRWAQFVGDKSRKFTRWDSHGLVQYLGQHPDDLARLWQAGQDATLELAASRALAPKLWNRQYGEKPHALWLRRCIWP